MTPDHGRCQHKIYFLSCEDYDSLWERAGGACEICRTPQADVRGGKLYIDHDHRYGDFAVRGLLCPRCNKLVARVEMTNEWHHEVSSYLKNAWFLGVLRARHAARLAADRSRRKTLVRAALAR